MLHGQVQACAVLGAVQGVRERKGAEALHRSLGFWVP